MKRLCPYCGVNFGLVSERLHGCPRTPSAASNGLQYSKSIPCTSEIGLVWRPVLGNWQRTLQRSLLKRRIP